MNSTASEAANAPSVKNDWGFIEFYDPRDWIRKWQIIDHLPSFLNISEQQAKELYFQAALSCDYQSSIPTNSHWQTLHILGLVDPIDMLYTLHSPLLQNISFLFLVDPQEIRVLFRDTNAIEQFLSSHSNIFRPD